MTSEPGIGVVITAHNAADTLSATLAALAAQSHLADGEMEIVVVDDRSTDGTSALLQSSRIPNSRALHIDTVPSPSRCTARQHALDVGVCATTAPSVVLLDADALPPTGWVRIVADALRRAPIVASGVAFVSASGTRRGRLLAAMQTVDAAYYLGWCRLLARGRAPSGMLFGAAAFRREIYDRIGGFCALGFTLTEDLTFARAAHRLNASIHFVDGDPVVVRACARWRDVVGRALRTGTTGGWSILAATLGIWGLLLPALGVAAVISGGAWWLALALRYVAGVIFVAYGLRRVRRLRLLSVAPAYEPTALVLGLVVLATATRVREVEWGGVRYPLQRTFLAPGP